MAASASTLASGPSADQRPVVGPRRREVRAPARSGPECGWSSRRSRMTYSGSLPEGPLRMRSVQPHRRSESRRGGAGVDARGATGRRRGRAGKGRVRVAFAFPVPAPRSGRCSGRSRRSAVTLTMAAAPTPEGTGRPKPGVVIASLLTGKAMRIAEGQVHRSTADGVPARESDGPGHRRCVHRRGEGQVRVADGGAAGERDPGPDAVREVSGDRAVRVDGPLQGMQSAGRRRRAGPADVQGPGTAGKKLPAAASGEPKHHAGLRPVWPGDRAYRRGSHRRSCCAPGFPSLTGR